MGHEKRQGFGVVVTAVYFALVWPSDVCSGQASCVADLVVVVVTIVKVCLQSMCVYCGGATCSMGTKVG